MNNFREISAGFLKILVLGGVVVFLVGLVQWGTRQPLGSALILQPAPSPGPIVVHMSGAVRQPGVYNLAYGSRVSDGISAAGGLQENANPESLNLAELLSDGQRVVVATLRPTVPPSVLTENTSPITSVQTGIDFPIDINRADARTLEALPEIGPAMAAKIIAYREANGPFQTIEAIQDVPGIGPLTFEAIKTLITVSP